MRRIGAAALLIVACLPRSPQPELTTFIDRMLAERKIPAAAVVVMREGRIVHASGHGGATTETIFQWGSIGKQFTAAGIIRLADQGRIRLDAPIATYLPEAPWPAVRVEHLIHQTSGIREFMTIPEFHKHASDLDRPVEELIAMIVREPLGFEPGSRWSYSNSNYTLAAQIIERVTGKPYDAYLREELFEPLGLRSVHHCPTVATPPAQARGYVLRGGELQPSDPENMNWARGDGGLCGSAMDLAKWTEALRIRAVALAPVPKLDMRPPRYGAGLAFVPLDDAVIRIGHNGAMSGFSASAAHYPEHQLTTAVVTNRGGVWADAIEKPIARRVLGRSQPDFAEVAIRDPDRYAGTFDVGVFDFPVRIERRGTELWLVMKRPAPSGKLRHIGGGEYVLLEEPDGVRVRFNEDASRAIVFFGGMEWYGVRSSPGTSAPDG
jgi:CubicO group peptidase (beta-lactamase class C family)